MAHMAKYGMASYSAILRHCERTLEATRERDNIDAERTELNYEIGEGDVRERVHECVEMHNDAGRGLRKDAKVMADWVVTKPRDLPDDRSREFFERTYEFIRDRYGADNVPRAYVHMDETTPHMHCPVVPFDEKANRLNATRMIDRADLRTFHGDLSDHIERTMGRRYAVELTEEQRQERAVEYKPMPEYQAAQDRLEVVRRALGEAERDLEREEQRRPGVHVGRRERTARELLRAAYERLRGVGELLRSARERARGLKAEIREVAGQKRELDARNQELRQEIRARNEELGHNRPAPDREQDREPGWQPDREPPRPIEVEIERGPGGGGPLGYVPAPPAPEQEQVEELELDRVDEGDYQDYEFEQEIDLFIER